MPGELCRLFAASGYSPASVSEAFWEADTGVLTDADGVHTHEDQANAYDLTQATGTKKPQYTTRNGLNVVSYDGLDDVMTHATLGNQLTGNWTMFMAAYFVDGGEITLAWGDEATGKRRSMWHNASADTINFSGYFSNVTTSYVVSDGWHYVVITWDGTTIRVRAAGSEQNSGTPTLNAYTGTVLAVGANAAGSENANVDVRDAGVVTSELTGSDLTDLETYLAGRIP